MNQFNLKKLDAFIYIDSSNIRNALKVSNQKINWEMLYSYFKNTYTNLKAVNFYEGIDKEDITKIEYFENLKKYGYEIRTLERKLYKNHAKYKIFRCQNCKEKNTVEILKESSTLKSNIDVYLCSDLMGNFLNYQGPVHGIILTCDGDYAEMIKNVLDLNINSHISVFATPFTKSNNYLSTRLKELERIDRYYLVNILNIKDRLSEKIEYKKESYT